MSDEHDGPNEAETTPIGGDDGNTDHIPTSADPPGDPSRAIVGDGSGYGPSERPSEIPERIGPYRVHSSVGRGGMGTVYKASHETDPGRRLVALKLIRRGMDTDDILGRFQVERQVLSALAHPYIARFFEAGEAEDGRPYIVMEYVEGQSITAYCDANNLSVPHRLELFRKVCEAVHHAHTNLVVHRDLKPENIIVTPEGDPKLLDFGIAKLLNPNMAPVVALTGPSMRLMTPEYASPEQVRGNPVNTLSDIYSLGVLLYELLSGHRPYHLVTRLEEEIVRVICESDPDRPSAAVSRVGTARRADGSTREVDPATIAQRRGGRPDTLRRLLSGDLDDIIMHAMSKAPASRYPTAKELSEDLGHYLSGQPVAARKSRRRGLYVARKFVRRHRTMVSVSTAAAAALLVLGAVSLWQYRARVEAELKAAQSELQLAESRNSELIRGAFGSVLWEKFSNRIIDVNLPARDRERLWTEIIEGFDTLREEHGTDNPVVREEYAKALKEMGDVLGGRRTGNVGDSKGALECYTMAAEIFEGLAESQPENDPLLYRAAVALIYKGDLLRELNRSALAMEAYTTAQATLDKMPGEGDWGPRRELVLSVMLLTHAQMAGRLCDIDEAVRLCRESVTHRESQAERQPDSERAARAVAIGHVNLGEILLAAGDAVGAEESFRRALAIRRDLLDELGPDKRRLRDMAVSRLALAGAMTEQGRHDSAAQYLGESETGMSGLVEQSPSDAVLRDLHCRIRIAATENLLAADIAEEALNAAEAADAALLALETTAPENASNSRLRSQVMLVLGEALLGVGRHDEARAALDEAMELSESLLAEDPTNAAFRRRVARVSIALGDLERARTVSDVGGVQSRDNEALALYRRAQRVYEEMEAEGRLCGVSEAAREALRASIEKLTAAGTDVPG